VILYGNDTTNGAWKALLGGSPVQVERGRVRIGSREERGDELACLSCARGPAVPELRSVSWPARA